MKRKIQKPFNVEAAKKGAVVETVDGNSVRILCYDRAEGGDGYPIIALINIGDTESCHSYTLEGKLLRNSSDRHDLVIIEEVEVTKFNVGDWVFAMDCTGYPLLITAITPHCYELQINEYKTEMYQTSLDIFYRLWTIKDAKPGDVLITEDDKRPFIFKEFLGHAPSAYCGIDTTDSIYVGTDGPWTRTTVRPATSNEKDMLFKKMEEEGYKWDAESLTVSKVQKRWRDDERVQIDGYFMNGVSQIVSRSGYNTCCYYNIFATEKQAKSALAMARISQIIANDERFGGVITDKEWSNWKKPLVIDRRNNNLIIVAKLSYGFLAFHTKEQAELFLKENEDLVKDYYMLD